MSPAGGGSPPADGGGFESKTPLHEKMTDKRKNIDELCPSPLQTAGTIANTNSVRGEKDNTLPALNFYNPKLKEFAKENRGQMTKAEACLWKYALSHGQMKGYNFNRQRPVLKYIADFMSKKLNLIIEVDGISHTLEGAFERDVKRQKDLEAAGFTVIRFTDDEVLKQIQAVRRVIYDTIEHLEKEIV